MLKRANSALSFYLKCNKRSTGFGRAGSQDYKCNVTVNAYHSQEDYLT